MRCIVAWSSSNDGGDTPAVASRRPEGWATQRRERFAFDFVLDVALDGAERLWAFAIFFAGCARLAAVTFGAFAAFATGATTAGAGAGGLATGATGFGVISGGPGALAAGRALDVFSG